MSTTDQVLSAFIDEWNAARRPRVREYLNRVPEGPARDELAEQITTGLEVGPTPDYDDETRAAIRSEPVVEHVVSAVGDDAGQWPAVLPQLRERQGLSIAQVAASLVQRFGLRSGDQPRTATYLERLERGDLEPTRVSRRLLDALGELLGASPGTLADAGSYGRGLRPAATGGALFRASPDAAPMFAADIEAQPGGAARAGADGRARPPVHRWAGRVSGMR
jgi:transcriptional regulator with XRE-family HTH domain